MASFANRDLVTIIPERNCNFHVIGCPFYPAKLIKASGTSGKKVADGSIKYTFSDANGTPAPIYKAVIPLEAAVPPGTAAVITTQPGGAHVDLGQNLAISVVAKNVASYKWYKNGVEPLGVNGDQITILNAEIGDAGTYRVVITGFDGGTVTSVDAILNVD